MKKYNQMTKSELNIALKSLVHSKKPSDKEMQTLHELQVHQIELEMQNLELRETHQSLEESRNRYADLYDFAPIGYATLDGAGCIREINLTGAKLLGKERAYLIGKPFIPYLANNHVDRFLNHIRQCVKTDERVVTELCLNAKGHDKMFVQLISVPVLDEDRSDKLYRTTIIDITERRRAEDALRESEAKLAGIIDSAMDAIVTVDEDFLIVLFNSAAEKLFGCSAYDAMAKPIDRFIPEFLRNVHRKHIRAFDENDVQKRRMGKGGLLYAVRANGEKFPIEASISKLMLGGKKYFTVVHRDITELKRVEDARKELLSRLIMAQEDERKRISRELHDQMGQHISALMLGFESLKPSCPPDSISLLEKLQQIADSLSGATHRLALELRPSILDDLGLDKALLNYVDNWSKNYNIKIDFQNAGIIEERFSPLIETALYRIAQEALLNIAKHAKADRVSFILVRRTDHILMIVEDDGSGFDVEAVMNSMKIENKLGLLGMKERVMLADGKIEIESAPGKGTTIYVRIPVGTQEATSHE